MGLERLTALHKIRYEALEKSMRSRGIVPVALDRPEGRLCNKLMPGHRPPWQINLGIKPLPPTLQTYFPSHQGLRYSPF